MPATTAAAVRAMAMQVDYQGPAQTAAYESCLFFLVEICSLLCSFKAVPQSSDGTPAELAVLDAPATTVLPAADCDPHEGVLDDAMTVSSHDFRSEYGDADEDHISEPSTVSKDGYDDQDTAVPENPSGDATDFHIVDPPEDWVMIR